MSLDESIGVMDTISLSVLYSNLVKARVAEYSQASGVVGLANIATRLTLAYGEKALFNFGNDPGTGGAWVLVGGTAREPGREDGGEVHG